MTDLSPAAERVLNAVTLKRYDVPYQACPKSIDQIRSDVAAALRAAADRVDVPNQPNVTLWENGFCAGISSAQEALRAIAAELEDANG